jgi:protein-disulfide isomerase
MNKKQTSAPQSRRQAMKAQRARRQRQQRLVTILIIAGVALVIAGLLIYPSLRPVGEFVRITPQARPQADFNAMGDPNAPVKIVDYSDFQCPFCKMFADETEQQIIDTYVSTGQVYYTFIPYGPGPQAEWIGPESEAAARAAFCAGDQDNFWEYKDYLFANQTGENVGDYTDKRLLAFGEALGLNMNDFQACFNSNQFDQTIEEGLDQGRSLGIQGTPAFTINGKVVVGALPFSDPSQPQDFQREIEAALAAAGEQ